MKEQKNIKWSISIILIFICVACTFSTDKVTMRLSQVEKLIWSQPDSALHILRSIPRPENLPKREQADYALLLSLAQYRCDIPALSDSLINIAVEYYNDKNTMDKRGGAWYMKGAILEETFNDIPKALIAYKKAESCIPNMKNKQIISRIYSSLGYLNYTAHDFELAKVYFKKSYNVNTDIKDAQSQISDLVNLSAIYDITHQPDSTDYCIKKLLEITTSHTDSVLQAKVYHNIAIRKMYQGNIEETQKYLLRALQVSFPHPSYKILAQLAELYIKTGQHEQADSIYYHVLNTSDLSVRASIYHNLYKENKATGNYKNAVHYADSYIAAADSFYNDKHNKEILNIQRKYDQMELLYQNTELNNRWLLTLLLSIVIISISLYIFKIYRRKMQLKNKTLHCEIISLQNKLYQNKTLYKNTNYQLQQQIDILELKLHEGTALHKEEQKTLQNKIKSLNEEKSICEKTYNKINNELLQQINLLQQEDSKSKGIINRMKLLYRDKDYLLLPQDVRALQSALYLLKNRTCDLSKNRTSLKHWLNISKDNFADKLKAVHPTLKENFLDICYLAVLGLSIEEIAQTMNVNIRTVERYMAQICLEVRYSERGKRGFIEFLNDFLSIKS